MILMTLLSTALQEYPDLRVVLLIDDPPNPRYAGPRRLLDSALRRCPARSSACSSEPRRRFDAALERFEITLRPVAAEPTAEEVHTLAGEYEYAAGWMRSLADQYHVSDHNERFFATHVLGQLATDLAADRPGPAHSRRPTIRRSSTADRVAPAVPPPRLDLPRRGLELPAQALRVALGRAEQGDEPEQLHRPDGRQLPRGPDPGRPEPRPAGDAGARPRRARIRLRADDRRRQRDHARVLPAPRPPAGARGAPAESPSRSRRTAPSPARRRGSSGSPARPPTCSTSSTRG